MVIEVYCGKCNTKIGSTNMLKPIKNTAGIVDNKCPSCGHTVSLTEFGLDVQESVSEDDPLRM